MMKLSNKERNDLYALAEKKWGAPAQRHVAIEEFAELISALARLPTNKGKVETVMNELADCYIMLEQMIFQFGRDEFRKVLSIKLESLKEKLNNPY
jgi:hypothetical protein